MRPIALTVFWILAAVCSASQVAILRAVIAGRAPAASRRRVARWAEVAWVVIPTVALVALLVATWGAVHAHAVTVSSVVTLGRS